MLEHEFVHIQRFDVLSKLLLIAAVCVHWFNPLVWVMYVLANRDLELSCDETVLRRFGGDVRAAYARVLIRMEAARGGFAPLCNHFGKNAIEERITAIMKTKRITIVSLGLAALLVAGTVTDFRHISQKRYVRHTGKGIRRVRRGECRVCRQRRHRRRVRRTAAARTRTTPPPGSAARAVCGITPASPSP
ncbi:MAG: M56 family metallopeptidase [Acutalibacteraceae bacterium]